MATKEFKLPDVGEGLSEAEIVNWLVEVGDEVSEDQPVAEAETDKAVVEVPSPVNGTVKEILAEEGEMVPVGDVIITFDVPDEDGVAEIRLDPGAQGPAEHVHRTTEERFEVREGTVTFRIDGRERRLGLQREQRRQPVRRGHRAERLRQPRREGGGIQERVRVESEVHSRAVVRGAGRYEKYASDRHSRKRPRPFAQARATTYFAAT